MIADDDRKSICDKKPITIEEILHARPQLPKASTRNRNWPGVTVDIHPSYSNCSEQYHGLDHHLICYCPSGSSKLTQIRAGRVHQGVVSAGMSYLMPAGYDSGWEGESGVTARLRIPVALVVSAAQQIGRRSVNQVEIRNVFETRDPILERLALIFMTEMELDPHPAQAIIVEATSTALAAHMIRRYNVFGVDESSTNTILTRRDLTIITKYIEDNAGRAIKLSELANLINVSYFHFARIFKHSTGHTAAQFVESSRIRYSQTLISGTDLPLAEIALMTGFADQSHFTRRFRRHTGCTPGVFARERGRRRPVW